MSNIKVCESKFFPLIIIILRPCTAYVNGKIFEIVFNTGGSVLTVKIMPESNTCGIITNGINCIA